MKRSACSRSVRHPVCKIDGPLCVNYTPVLPSAGPLLRNIYHRQIQHLQQTVIRREDRFCLGHFPELPVKALDRVGRIDQAAHLLRVLEIGAQVGSILPPGPSDLGVFSVPAFRKSVQCSNLIDSGVGCLHVCHERLYVLVGHIGIRFH